MICDIKKIERDTILQSECELWKHERKKRITASWLTSSELREAIEQLSDVESVVASDEDEYVPQLSDGECEESDIENDPVVEQDDSESKVEQEEPTQTPWAGVPSGVTHHQHKGKQ
ncbi:hypothetical protein RI129_003273 [Pyrocoelia pectoralis]|uniref:Uncharacterized protein n=1 Tax=Pyrocoelia pectoralis TaxID=417401 RepID=A0AAN7ZUD6_9COLE